MLESELIITATNVGCLRPWVCVCFCVCLYFFQRDVPLSDIWCENTRSSPLSQQGELTVFAHKRRLFCVRPYGQTRPKSPKRVNLQQINTEVEKR